MKVSLLSMRVSFFTFCIAVGILLIGVISGCGNDSPAGQNSPSVITVTGKVIDNTGNGIGNTSVAVGSQVVTASSDGSFTLTNVSIPYDLTIARTDSDLVAIVYQGLTITNPQVLGVNNVKTSNKATLTVHIPVLNQGQQALIFFSNGREVIQSQYISFPDTQADLSVSWSGATSLSGRLGVLVYSGDFGGPIITYDHYGEKTSYTLNNNDTRSESFSNADLTLNPGETEVSGSLSIPPGYANAYTSLYLKSGNEGNIALGLVRLFRVDGISFTFKMPTGLPGITPVLLHSASNSTSYSVTHKYVYGTEAGKVPTLDVGTDLLTPADKTTDVDATTQFTYSSPPGNGINMVIFEAAKELFVVVTEKATTTLPDFSALGLHFSAKGNYSWHTQRFGGLTSVNDMASGPLSLNTKYNGITSESGERSFTTR